MRCTAVYPKRKVSQKSPYPIPIPDYSHVCSCVMCNCILFAYSVAHACSFCKTSAVETGDMLSSLDTSAVQTLQFAKSCFTVTLFLHCSVQSLSTVECFKPHGIVISWYLRYVSRYCGTTIYRDLDDTGIVIWYHDTYRGIADIAQH